MGCYVNPSKESKEDWLEKNGEVVKPETINFEELEKKGYFPVILVDNGLFTAAGVAYSKNEFERFTCPGDKREKICYTVKKEKLMTVSDLKEWIT